MHGSLAGLKPRWVLFTCIASAACASRAPVPARALFPIATNWTVTVALTNGANPLTVRGYDRLGVSNAVDTITITRQ